MKLKLVLSLSVALLSCASLNAQNLLNNGDFEYGSEGWSLYVPQEAKSSDCQMRVVTSGAQNGEMACEMASLGSARYALVNYLKGHEYAPGQRYRVTFWVRAGDDFKPQAGTPGYLARVTMFNSKDGWAGAQDGLICIGTGDKVVRSGDVGSFSDQEVPTKWTKLSAVFEISPDTAKMNVCVFVWNGSGSFYVDNVSIEQVDSSTPLSELHL